MHFNNLLTLSQAAAQVARKREKNAADSCKFEKDGWKIVDTSREKLVLKENIDMTAPGTTLNVNQGTIPVDIFLRMVTPQFVAGVLEDQ